MIDVKLIDQGSYFDIEWADDGDFVKEDGFDTALLMSIFCQKRASQSEIADPMMRSGWVGNATYNGSGEENGSKVWLYTTQGRMTNNTLNAVKNEAKLGLDWMAKEKIAKRITTSTESDGENIGLGVDIEYPSSFVDHRYFDIWSKTG